MRRKEDHPITKHTLNLYAGDYAAIQQWAPRAGASKVIRSLVHKFVRDIREAAAQQREAKSEFSMEDVDA